MTSTDTSLAFRSPGISSDSIHVYSAVETLRGNLRGKQNAPMLGGSLSQYVVHNLFQIIDGVIAIYVLVQHCQCPATAKSIAYIALQATATVVAAGAFVGGAIVYAKVTHHNSDAECHHDSKNDTDYDALTPSVIVSQ